MKSRMTISEAFAEGLKRRRQWRDSKSPATLEATYRAVAAHFGGATPISKISAEGVRGYVDGLRQEGKAATTLNSRLALVRVLWAIAGVPAPTVERATVRAGRKRLVTPDEEQRVLEWFRQSTRSDLDAHMVRLVGFQIDTGLRLGETMRLTYRDLDEEARIVSIWENKASHPRRIPLSSRALHAALAGDWKGGAAGRCFAPLTVDNAEKRWKAMRLAINMHHDPAFVIHALRHTCCSRMVSRGFDAFRVQKFMGHKNIATTLLYVSLDAEDLRGLLPVE